MLMVMMSLGDLAFQGYVQSVLSGAVQKAARDSTIQGNATSIQSTQIDLAVKNVLSRLVPSATFSSSRSNFDNYAAIAGEPFTDTRFPDNNAGTLDGVCNHNESYVDVNSNGRYDLNLGNDGQGGANDVTKYSFTVTYRRLFPIPLVGLDPMVTISTTTILKNQPYATQSVNSGTKTGICA